MEGPVSRPKEQYINAFVAFSGAQRNQFEINIDHSVSVEYSGLAYRVCHFNDLLWEFKTYFDTDLSLIYTEVPFGLWEKVFKTHQEITKEALIAELYKSWKIYWDNEERRYVKKDTYNEAKEESWEDLQVLIARSIIDLSEVVEHAIEIADIVLIPILALAIRSCFKNTEAFYEECVFILIDFYPESYTESEEIHMIKILTEDSSGPEPFYVYELDGGVDDDSDEFD